MEVNNHKISNNYLLWYYYVSSDKETQGEERQDKSERQLFMWLCCAMS